VPATRTRRDFYCLSQGTHFHRSLSPFSPASPPFEQPSWRLSPVRVLCAQNCNWVCGPPLKIPFTLSRGLGKLETNIRPRIESGTVSNIFNRRETDSRPKIFPSAQVEVRMTLFALPPTSADQLFQEPKYERTRRLSRLRAR